MNKQHPSRLSARIGKTALSAVLAVGMMPGLSGVAYANETSQSNSDAAFDAVVQKLFAQTDSQVQQYLETGNLDSSASFDYDSEQASSSLSSMATYEPRFSLQNVGGTWTFNKNENRYVSNGDGKNYVTSVKFQNPFGACWAFAATSAAEESILYEEGITADSEEGKLLNLSERHLAWFANRAIDDESDSQNGEGRHYFTDPGSKSMDNGSAFEAASAYAMGIGALTEYVYDESGAIIQEIAPYHGALKQVVAKNSDGERVTMSYDDAKAAGYTILQWSSDDDWSLPESMRYAQTYALEEANILPSITPQVNSETGKYEKNTDGINAVKEQLTSGKAVAISFLADSSTPGSTNKLNRYINSNYAHYTFESRGVNHGVTIVGWDDNYSASNFTNSGDLAKWDANNFRVYKLSEAYKTAHASEIPAEYLDAELPNASSDTPYYVNASGQKVVLSIDDCTPVIDCSGAEAAAKTTPAGDGAWIVKNSWGSADQEGPYGNNWGIDGTGYFYISYYDMSVTALQTFDFYTGDEAEEAKNYTYVNQYDCLPAMLISSITTGDQTRMANVFTADGDMKLTGVSVETSNPGTTAEISIYKLVDGASSPTDGDCVAKIEETFEYGGYHRISLDNDLYMPEGQHYSIVVEESYQSVVSGQIAKQSVLCVNSAANEYIMKLMDGQFYSTAVINKDESYLGVTSVVDGSITWKDWSEVVDDYAIFSATGHYVDYDNFSIKAYGEPADGVITTQPQDAYANANSNVTLSVSTSGEVASYQWQHSKDGTTWHNTAWSGATTNKLSFKMLAALNDRQWRCIVTFADGHVETSMVASTTLVTTPTITMTPEVATVGSPVSLSIDAIDGVTYQWQHSKDGTTWCNTKWEGYDTNELTFTMLAALDGRQWRCVVTFPDGHVEASQVASTTLATTPTITMTPEVATVGSPVSLSIDAIDGAAYQWQHSKDGKTWSNTKWEGYDTNELTFTMLAALDGRQWRCAVTLPSGSLVYSQVATTSIDS